MHSKLNIVVLAAGQGTRMKSKLPKVLHRAGGRTLIEHVIGTASSLTDPEWITVVVGHRRHQVEASLATTGVKFVEQAEQKGTGHALMMCRAGLEERGGVEDPGRVGARPEAEREFEVATFSYGMTAVMLRFGTWPTGMCVTTFCDATSMTATQFEPAQATYSDLPSGVNVTHSGS